MNRSFFITGTDTEIGKTFVSQRLMKALVEKGFRVSGFKPIAAGCERLQSELQQNVWVNDDALALQQASNVPMRYVDVNPYSLRQPSSPHIAAQCDDITIDFARLNQALTTHKSLAEMTLIEGAGGWRVPLANQTYLSDWVQQQQIPVVLVVGIRLGCLNHAILTWEALKRDGVKVLGWIANCVDSEFKDIEENIAFLQQHISAPQLGEIPFIGSSREEKIPQWLDIEKLISQLD
ncbi:dethiobiotin synthase [Vibrio gangliei]|uniref:dethiobiotin synthase n=1 Tax=Vibrio gangliei TaxID=2077090 RepID=UPI000D0163BF|nr:dethiobiotin synthase [Vibrio gangliei]